MSKSKGFPKYAIGVDLADDESFTCVILAEFVGGHVYIHKVKSVKGKVVIEPGCWKSDDVVEAARRYEELIATGLRRPLDEDD